MLARGACNPPAVWVQTGNMNWIGFTNIHKPNPQRLGGPNPDSYPATAEVCGVWLDPSVRISGSVFWVLLFMVAFRYPTANQKTLTVIRHCPFQLNRPLLLPQTRETHAVPYPEQDTQRRVNDYWSCIMSNLGGS